MMTLGGVRLVVNDQVTRQRRYTFDPMRRVACSDEMRAEMGQWALSFFRVNDVCLVLADNTVIVSSTTAEAIRKGVKEIKP
jgi:hypothetical protein